MGEEDAVEHQSHDERSLNGALLLVAFALGLVLVSWLVMRGRLHSPSLEAIADAEWSVSEFDGIGSEDVIAIGGDRVFMGGSLSADASQLIGIEAASGEVVWRVDTDWWPVSAEYADGDVLVYHASNNKVAMLRASDGDSLWEGRAGTLNAVLRSDAGLHLTGYFEDSVDVWTLDPATGDVLWRRKIPGDTLYSSRYEVADNLLLLHTTNRLVGLDINSGETVWRIDIDLAGETYHGGVVVDGDLAVLVHPNGDVFRFDPTTGSLAWRRQLVQPADYGPLRLIGVADETIVIDAYEGVFAFNEAGEEVWHLPRSEDCFISAAAIADELVLIDVPGGYTAAVDIASGEKRWIVVGHLDQEEPWAEVVGSNLFLALPGTMGVVDLEASDLILSLPITTDRGRRSNRALPVFDGDTFYVPGRDGEVRAYTVDSLLKAAEHPQSVQELERKGSCFGPVRYHH